MREITEVAAAFGLRQFPYIAFPAPEFFIPEPLADVADEVADAPAITVAPAPEAATEDSIAVPEIAPPASVPAEIFAPALPESAPDRFSLLPDMLIDLALVMDAAPAPAAPLPVLAVPVAPAPRRVAASQFSLLADMEGLAVPPVPEAAPPGVSLARIAARAALPVPDRRPARAIASQVLAIARVAGRKDH